MRKNVFLTGATGSMGFEGLKQLLSDNKHNIILLARPSSKNKELLKDFEGLPELQIRWGDLLHYKDVAACVQKADIVLHCAAFVSPEADYHPEMAMRVNYGSTVNLIRAIRESGRPVKLVNIGTVAETGDRMPPIHWGRTGDPLKPSVHDYYAVSKIAAERAVIESGLKYWVSLRQTGILSEKMSKTNDGIMFHNCLNNVLEYVTAHDSGVLLKNVCEDLPEDFWRRIYNIGGGKNCRLSCYEMFQRLFGAIGLTRLDYVFDAGWFATRNFHGHFFQDSDVLENYLHFRSQGFDAFMEVYLKSMGMTAKAAQFLTRLPGGEKLIGGAIRSRFKRTARTDHGTLNWIEQDRQEYIEPFFISREEWERIPSMKEFKPYDRYDTVCPIRHGYEEGKPKNRLGIRDMKAAAVFRGGLCLSKDMEEGALGHRLSWKCAFGHFFEASPKLVLEGGHWCPQCERDSWNYHELARRSEFFAQVWYPLHRRDEPVRVYPKRYSELTI